MSCFPTAIALARAWESIRDDVTPDGERVRNEIELAAGDPGLSNLEQAPVGDGANQKRLAARVPINGLHPAHFRVQRSHFGVLTHGLSGLDHQVVQIFVQILVAEVFRVRGLVEIVGKALALHVQHHVKSLLQFTQGRMR